MHELRVMLYALRRLGIYARIHDKTRSIPIIQISGEDTSKLVSGISKYSVKVLREKNLSIKHKKVKRGAEKVIKAERVNYDGYVYDLSVGKYHNYEASLIYIHNCIDEFDKISDDDRASLHEALESQTISVAKAGIVATFTAKAAVLAAANPKYGRFDQNAYPAEQFDIPTTLLSRFDLIFPIKDTMDVEQDKNIARHILMQHYAAGAQIADIKQYEQVELPPMNGELLRRYIAYARKSVMPRLGEEASSRIQEYYIELRQLGSKSGAVAITPRQIEGLVRMAEASAKARLSKIVEIADAERAIALSEYMLKTLAVDRGGRRDIDTILTGMPREKVDKINSITAAIRKLEETEGVARIQRVIEEAAKEGTDETTVNKYINELERIGELYRPKPGVVKLIKHENE
jgi:replicative DNA helicase Mcm